MNSVRGQIFLLSALITEWIPLEVICALYIHKVDLTEQPVFPSLLNPHSRSQRAHSLLLMLMKWIIWEGMLLLTWRLRRWIQQGRLTASRLLGVWISREIHSSAVIAERICYEYLMPEKIRQNKCQNFPAWSKVVLPAEFWSWVPWVCQCSVASPQSCRAVLSYQYVLPQSSWDISVIKIISHMHFSHILHL